MFVYEGACVLVSTIYHDTNQKQTPKNRSLSLNVRIVEQK